ncbi:MAG: polysaccharide deacetylase family protein [Chthonomonadales bacterium]
MSLKSRLSPPIFSNPQIWRSAAASIVLASALAGCNRKPAPTAAVIPVLPVKPKVAEVDLRAYKPNEAGTIMIVMYHRFETKYPSNDRNLNRRPEDFQKDLENLYQRKYYPVNVSDIVDGKLDVPAGKTPIALTFDDSWDSQFKLIAGTDGQPHIDPDCAVGIMEKFHKAHADWPLKGTFFVLPQEGKKPPTFYQADSVDQKLAYLIKNGYEVANHTSTHSSLRGKSAEKVQWEIATAVKDIRAVDKTATMDVLALPYGQLPGKAVQKFLIEGESGGQQYHNKAVLLAAWRPIMSPFTQNNKKVAEQGKFAVYNPYRLERIKPDPTQAAVPGTFEYWLSYYDLNPSKRYISDGNPKVVSVPKAYQSHVDPGAVQRMGLTLQIYSLDGSKPGAPGAPASGNLSVQ